MIRILLVLAAVVFALGLSCGGGATSTTLPPPTASSGCGPQNPCSGGSQCVNGTCVSQVCTSDADCSGGTCVQGTCQTGGDFGFGPGDGDDSDDDDDGDDNGETADGGLGGSDGGAGAGEGGEEGGEGESAEGFEGVPAAEGPEGGGGEGAEGPEGAPSEGAEGPEGAEPPPPDSDGDGVSDFDDLCPGETPATLPASTPCLAWTFDSAKGCHQKTPAPELTQAGEVSCDVLDSFCRDYLPAHNVCDGLGGEITAVCDPAKQWQPINEGQAPPGAQSQPCADADPCTIDTPDTVPEVCLAGDVGFDPAMCEHEIFTCPQGMACGDSDGTCHCGGTPTTVTGTVYLPNGKTPAPNAFVYAAAAIPAPFAPEADCQICPDLATFAAHTVAGADGGFSLAIPDDLAQAGFYLVMEQGLFRRTVQPKFTPCGPAAISALETVLPKADDLTQGDQAPAIAVVGGDKSDLEVILNAMGLSGSSYTRINGDAANFLSNEASMAIYHLVLLNDGLTLSGITGAVTSSVAGYVQSGGRILALGSAMPVLEQSFPASPPYLKLDTAPTTARSQISGDVFDPVLVAWLKGLNPDFVLNKTSVRFEGFPAGWTAIDAIDTSTFTSAQGTLRNRVELLAEGYYTRDRPLAAQYYITHDPGSCGRVAVASFVNQGASQPEFIAQDYVLMQMILGLGACRPSDL